MYRFLPALFKMKKGRIFNVLVDDRQRFAGISKFNFNNRFWIGMIDLFKVWLLINKKEKNEWRTNLVDCRFYWTNNFCLKIFDTMGVSERASKSIIPNIFLWISLAGSMVLLSYAIHKVDQFLLWVSLVAF